MAKALRERVGKQYTGTQRTRKAVHGEGSVELATWTFLVISLCREPYEAKVSRTGLTGGMGRRTGRQRALCLPSPWSDGTTGIRLSPLELLEKLAALVPLPHVHLVRYGGCLAPHSHLRGAILPTPRQQGLDEPEAHLQSSRWSWARLLQRVVGLDLAHCPFCPRGTLRLIAVITQG